MLLGSPLYQQQKLEFSKWKKIPVGFFVHKHSSFFTVDNHTEKMKNLEKRTNKLNFLFVKDNYWKIRSRCFRSVNSVLIFYIFSHSCWKGYLYILLVTTFNIKYQIQNSNIKPIFGYICIISIFLFTMKLIPRIISIKSLHFVKAGFTMPKNYFNNVLFRRNSKSVFAVIFIDIVEK